MRLAFLVFAALVLAACAPASAPAAGPEGGALSNRRAVKLLVMGRYNTNEPKAGIVPFGPGGSAGQADFPFIFHAGLTTHDPSSNLLPWIASKVPSIDDGDWKVLPDGQMELTWKLRPGVTWRD